MKKYSIKIEQLNIFLYVIYILSYIIICEFFEDNDFIFDMKHYILLFCYTISLVCLLYKYNTKKARKEYIYSKKTVFIVIVAAIFIGLSLFKAISVNHEFSFRSIVQTSLFVLPTLYGFNLINVLKKENVIKLFKITTVIFIIFYFTEPSHTIPQFFNINNWINIDYTHSNSFTESHICAETFLQLFLVFFYIKNYTDTNVKNIKLYTVITCIFTILSFKRLAILFVILLIVFKKIIKYDKNMPFKSDIIFSLIFVGLTYLYIQFISGQLNLGININTFSTNRDYLLSLWGNADYYSYGYGTSLYVIGRYLEMDLVQIYMEIGPVALFLFCYTYFRIADKKIYANLILLYYFFNLLTSSTMPWTSGWLIFAMSLCLIASDKMQNDIKDDEIKRLNEKNLINNNLY